MRVYSASSTAASVTLSAATWRLKDPLDAARNATVRVLGNEFVLQREVPATVLRPLGSSAPIVITDTVSTESGEVTLRADSEAELNAIVTMVRSGRTLFLSDVSGHSWYIRPTDRISVTRMDAPALWLCTVSFVVVTAP